MHPYHYRYRNRAWVPVCGSGNLRKLAARAGSEESRDVSGVETFSGGRERARKKFNQKANHVQPSCLERPNLPLSTQATSENIWNPRTTQNGRSSLVAPARASRKRNVRRRPVHCPGWAASHCPWPMVWVSDVLFAYWSPGMRFPVVTLSQTWCYRSCTSPRKKTLPQTYLNQKRTHPSLKNRL